MAFGGAVKDIDRGWAALKRELARQTEGGGLYGKAGVIGEKGQTDHGAEGWDTTAGTKRDAQGRFLKGSGAKTHHEHVEGELTNAELALIHEFGLGVPERSFLRAAFDRNQPKYLDNLQKLIAAVYDGKISIERALGLLSQQAASDMRNFIRERQVEPANSEATIARKGSSVPLIDSGQLINALTGAVERGSNVGEG